MNSVPAPKSSRDKVRAHRARMRAQGLRQITLWVPDTRTEEFRRQAHLDSLAISASEGEKDDLAFIESLIEWPD